MTTKEVRTQICFFCGRERIYTITEEDGSDYDGHARGNSYTESDDPGCDCAFGKLQHMAEEGNPPKVRKMCMNCAYYHAGKCTNESVAEGLSTMFNIKSDLWVKDPRNVCEHHKLKLELFEKLLLKE